MTKFASNFQLRPRTRLHDNLARPDRRARRVCGSNDIDSVVAVHHYTEESAAARDELDSARDAIERASGANTQQAEQTFANAVEAFERSGPRRAGREPAQQAQQSAQTQQTLLLVGGGLIVLLLLVGGGYYAYARMSAAEYSKL